MILKKINEQYERVLARLQDEESINIFNCRVDYMITRDQGKLERDLFNKNAEYTCFEVDNILSGSRKSIIIFGAGLYGKKTKYNLDSCKKYNIRAFCDNNKAIIGEMIDDVPIISVEDAVKDEDCIIIIASRVYGREMYNQLIDMRVDTNRVIVPTLAYPEIQCGWQYFDVFAARDNEVFIDAGTYDGGTIVDFYKWLNGKNGICYGMEPVSKVYDIAVENINRLKQKNVKIYKNAAWNKNEDIAIVLDVKANGEIWGGSSVSKTGNIIIKGMKIDDIVEQNQHGVTMIKMDIEGSELNALEGASECIRKYKPRLAISVYHKPQDILELADYILNLEANYKFYIRHYTGDGNETVLYASID